ncbi:MAG: hypothetical protein R6V45_14050 [Oceanipulchritudo sp.]
MNKSRETTTALQERRYSLRELLSEVEKERDSSSIGQEMIDQSEIGKLFERKKKVRRGKSGK